MNPMRRMRIWAGRIGLGRKLAIALAIPALASGVATYLALTGAPPFGPHPNAVLLLLNLDLILLLALGAVIAKRLIEVWAERRRGLAGSRLQIRLVVLFSLIAVMPTIIVGNTAIRLNSTTSRICSREPARPRRRSAQTSIRRLAITAPSASSKIRSRLRSARTAPGCGPKGGAPVSAR